MSSASPTPPAATDLEAWRASGSWLDLRDHRVFYRREGREPTTKVVRLEVGHYPQVEAPDEMISAYLDIVTPLRPRAA